MCCPDTSQKSNYTSRNRMIMTTRESASASTLEDCWHVMRLAAGSNLTHAEIGPRHSERRRFVSEDEVPP